MTETALQPKPQSHWYEWWGWKLVAGAVGIGLAVWGILRFDPFGWLDAGLVALPQPPASVETDDGTAYIPWGDNRPTFVNVQNSGDNAGLIQAVAFTIVREKPTPDRADLVSAVETVPVRFEDQHFDKSANGFFLPLEVPVQLEGHGNANFDVAIVQPNNVGKTYVGTLTIYYDDNETLSIEGVDLDVMKESPPDAEPL